MDDYPPLSEPIKANELLPSCVNCRFCWNFSATNGVVTKVNCDKKQMKPDAVPCLEHKFSWIK